MRAQLGGKDETDRPMRRVSQWHVIRWNRRQLKLETMHIKLDKAAPLDVASQII